MHQLVFPSQLKISPPKQPSTQSSTFGSLNSQASATSLLPMQRAVPRGSLPKHPRTFPSTYLFLPPLNSGYLAVITIDTHRLDCTFEIRSKTQRRFEMASSDKTPTPNPASRPGDQPTPLGKPMTMGQHVLDKGAEMMQSLKPVNQMNQHVCTFALYSHDMTRQIETHHYVTRLNQDFLQCAVYDSDDSHGRLIGVEYIVSDKIFESLPPDEQKLWHSHAYEIKAGLWVNPRIPEMIGQPELQNLAKTYGKFWCTWQVDRGDRLPLGAPALMMSPQPVNLGMVKPELLETRDAKYNISTDALKTSRVEIAEPEWINPQADYWKLHGKGFAVDVKQTEMKKITPFP